MRVGFIIGGLMIGLVVLGDTYLLRPKYHNLKKLSPMRIELVKKIQLPHKIDETSGLIRYRGLVWTFNDSGGEPELYGVSEADSAIAQTVVISNGSNADWEDIAQDSAHIFVGDFGNNFGTRNNLCIYIIDKKDIPETKTHVKLKAKRIEFTFPEYKPALIPSERSAFDCEAMVCKNDTLYIFTKNWVDLTTTLYTLPAHKGKYLAQKKRTFNAMGLITAATYNSEMFCLLGYELGCPFLWIFKPSDDKLFIDESAQRFDLEKLAGTQTEGIAIVNDSTILLSSEKTKIHQSLYYLKIRK